MRVAAFQFDVQRADVAANLAAVEQGLREAHERAVQLVVLPEMWPTSFDPAGASAASDAALERVRALSGELALVVCGSAFAARARERPSNRLHVFAHGRSLPAYDKVHLFTPTGERELFQAGDAPPATVASPVGLLSGVICYDVRFGPLVQVPFAAGAEVLVVPAQWPAPRAEQWRALVAGRAVEGQALVVAANRTGSERVGRGERALDFPGNSLVVGPSGALLAEGRGAAGLVVADLEPQELRELRRALPVERDRRPELYARWAKEVRAAHGQT